MSEVSNIICYAMTPNALYFVSASPMFLLNRYDNALAFFFLQCMIVQYGRILDIDLKIPPRPPGYAFVEVRIFCYCLIL